MQRPWVGTRVGPGTIAYEACGRPWMTACWGRCRLEPGRTRALGLARVHIAALTFPDQLGRKASDETA